jgi:hypothetical protein
MLLRDLSDALIASHREMEMLKIICAHPIFFTYILRGSAEAMVVSQ